MAALVIIGIVVLAALVFLLWWISASNSFKRRKIQVQESLSGIEVALTKRYDMLTKLLDTARGYMAHEKDLFTQVIKLRRGMSVQEMSQASEKMGELSTRLFAVAENYPQLRSAEVFVQLQRGIHDAEDHLQAARRLYNANVSAFNSSIAVFPGSLVANSQGLAPMEFFVAEEHKRADVKMSF